MRLCSCCCAPSGGRDINASELDVSHFKERGVIGEGGFGLVLLVTKASRPAKGRYFALKKITKSLIVANNLYAETHQEIRVIKRLFSSRMSPFLCQHFAAWQDETHLFMVMQIARGGDLASHLADAGRLPLHEAARCRAPATGKSFPPP